MCQLAKKGATSRQPCLQGDWIADFDIFKKKMENANRTQRVLESETDKNMYNHTDIQVRVHPEVYIAVERRTAGYHSLLTRWFITMVSGNGWGLGGAGPFPTRIRGSLVS